MLSWSHSGLTHLHQTNPEAKSGRCRQSEVKLENIENTQRRVVSTKRGMELKFEFDGPSSESATPKPFWRWRTAHCSPLDLHLTEKISNSNGDVFDQACIENCPDLSGRTSLFKGGYTLYWGNAGKMYLVEYSYDRFVDWMNSLGFRRRGDFDGNKTTFNEIRVGRKGFIWPLNLALPHEIMANMTTINFTIQSTCGNLSLNCQVSVCFCFQNTQTLLPPPIEEDISKD